MRPWNRTIDDRNIEVHIAVRDVSRAKRVLDPGSTRIQQAPILDQRPRTVIDTPTCYAHLLHNTGFAEAATLQTLAHEWRELFASINPDLILFEHSPTALLASRGLDVKRVVLGTGFVVPQPGALLSPFRNMNDSQKDEAIRDENNVLATANAVLQDLNAPRLDNLSDLYTQADRIVLSTYSELDHFGPRDNVDYVGPPDPPAGQPPQWPEYPGPRIFAYLKSFPGIEHLFTALFDLGWPTLIVGDGIPESICDEFTGPAMRFSSEHLDIKEVGRSCDLAIINGNHGSSIDLPRCGVPLLQIPLSIEQLIMARRTADLGFATILPTTSITAHTATHMLEHMLATPSYRQAAAAFAERHRSDTPHDVRVAQYLDEFLTSEGLA